MTATEQVLQALLRVERESILGIVFGSRLMFRTLVSRLIVLTLGSRLCAGRFHGLQLAAAMVAEDGSVSGWKLVWD